MRARAGVWLTSLLTTGLVIGAGGCDPARPAHALDRVTVMAGWNAADTPEERLKFMSVLDRFTDLTGFPVTYVEPVKRDQFVAELGKYIKDGRPPDVALLPQPGLLTTLANCNALTPLPASVRDTAEKNFNPMWLNLGKVGSTAYGVVFKTANKSMVWYDTDMFRSARVEPPRTWDQFLKAAADLRRTSPSAVAIGGGSQWVLTDWFENVYLRQAGPKKYDALAAHTIPWTDPSVERALVALGRLWGQPGLVSGNPATMPLDQSVQQVFEQHNAAMVFEGDFLVNQVLNIVGSELGDTAKVFSFPSFGPPSATPAATVMVGADTAVMTNNTPGSAKLMEYLASADSARIWAASGGLISPNKNVPPEVYPDPVSRQSATELANARLIRFDLSDLLPPEFGSTPSEGLWAGLHELLSYPVEQRGTLATIRRTMNILEARARSTYNRPHCPNS
jgi:ABC-type glycerol-3-phosphate transport system substrate-binding protein